METYWFQQTLGKSLVKNLLDFLLAHLAVVSRPQVPSVWSEARLQYRDCVWVPDPQDPWLWRRPRCLALRTEDPVASGPPAWELGFVVLQ